MGLIPENKGTKMDTTRKFLISFDTEKMSSLETDVLVIGSGVAGLRAAIESARFGKVLIITKGKFDENNTERAQGGIAVVLSKMDSFKKHREDSLRAGKKLCDIKAVNVLVKEGPARINELLKWGINFDKEKGKLLFTREAGHCMRRILHARGDSTGKELEKVLIRKVKQNKNIRILEYTYAIDLLHKEGVCFGSIVETKGDGCKVVYAQKTILATGGIGQLYRETTNSVVSTGCGVALAYRAGAKIIDMEFIQFHPTTLYIAGASRILISEAARGEGGVLRNKFGIKFMKKYDKERELASRDVVARAIFNEMRDTKSAYVYLDLTHLNVEFLKKRFPYITKTCFSFGIDIKKHYIPVCPTAHYMIGGIKTNMKGETGIINLYACGETACLGLHGANRLASNSLLEGLVFGYRAGICAGESVGKRKKALKISNKFNNEKLKELDSEDIRKSLKSLMTRFVGIERDRETLLEARKEIVFWSSYVIRRLFSTSEGWELQNMLTVAKIIQESALLRKESRGGHYRKDYPAENDIKWSGKHIEFSIKDGCRVGKI